MYTKTTKIPYEGDAALGFAHNQESDNGYWPASRIKRAIVMIRNKHGRALTQAEFELEAAAGNCPPLEQIRAQHTTLAKFFRAHGFTAVRSRGGVN